MKITKYPQSCLLVESGGIRLLFDPGSLKREDHFVQVFSGVDAIFITHKHADHCDDELLQKVNLSIPLYITKETRKAHPSLSRAEQIREGDEIIIGSVSVKAVHAIHGYHPRMRGNEVYENIGYIVDDRKKRLYITGDTICFPTDIKTDIIALPVTGHGVTMSAFEASLFAKETGAKTVILTHMDNPAFEVDRDYIDRHFKNAGVEYTLLDSGETLTVE